jgi:hypothetical protein
LIDYLRPEKKFDGLDALKAQIAADCGEARRLLAAYAGPEPGAVPLPAAPAPTGNNPQSFYERALGPRRPRG